MLSRMTFFRIDAWRKVSQFRGAASVTLLVALIGAPVVPRDAIAASAGASRRPAALAGALPGAEDTFTGVSFIRYTCSDDEDSGNDVDGLALIDDLDKQTKVLVADPDILNEAGGIDTLDRKHVIVDGFEDTSDPDQLRIIVTSIAIDSTAPAVAPFTGQYRMITLLVRFADYTPTSPSPNTTPDPKPRNRYLQLINGRSPNTYPSLDHYYRQVSGNTVNVLGDVIDWYTLPNNRADYLSGIGLNMDKLTREAVASAPASVFFPQYTAICVVPNLTIGLDGGVAGSIELSTDLPSLPDYPQTSKRYDEIVISNRLNDAMDSFAHEMGHTLGMRHSGSSYTNLPRYEYHSQYDVMSKGGACVTPDSDFGCVPVEPIAANKFRVNYVPASRVYTASWNSVSPPIWIERVGNPSPPSSTTQYLHVEIPIGSNTSQTRYTLEARRYNGAGTYENQLPGEGVVIHKSVNNGRSTVVDVDEDEDCNDTASRWIPGETFLDCTPNNQVKVEVLEASSTGYEVRISTGAAVGTCPPPTNDGAMEFGQILSGTTRADNYLSAPDSLSLSQTGSLTVEAWIQTSTINKHQGIVSKRRSTSGGGGYELRLDKTNRIEFATYVNGNDGTARASVMSTQTVSRDTWYHVSGSYDAEQKRLRVSVNGFLTLGASAASSKAPQDGSTALNIGRKGTMNHYFRGKIDLVRISRSVKYQDPVFEPSTDYSYDLEDTVAFWSFDDAIQGMGATDTAPPSIVPPAGNNPATRTGSPLPRWTTGVTVLSGSSTSSPDTIGVFDPTTSTFFLRNDNSSGPADYAFAFGLAGSGAVPIAGDWDGDGIDTIGLYAPTTSEFFLRDANSSGLADLTFVFGATGQSYVPIAGDWDGDGDDSIGLYHPATGTFLLKHSNEAGAADLAFGFGPGGSDWTPVKGDWDGDGDDTIGIFSNAAGQFWFLRNDNTAGFANLSFGYGPPQSKPIAGDWNSDGTDTVGTYLPSSGTFFLRNENSPGNAHHAFGFGPSGLKAIAGDWDGGL